MALYGLQNDFLNNILKTYFGKGIIDKPVPEIYVGLGLAQEGANINTEDFDEIFSGKPENNYQRARIIFGEAADGMTTNIGDVLFQTASGNWSTDLKCINMIGLFTTSLNYNETGNDVPLVVLPLRVPLVVNKGNTLLFEKGSISLKLSDI